jgi:hypothetical protein
MEFQCLITDLDWNDTAKWATLHWGLNEELKDILSTQYLTEEWSCSVGLVKKHNMQYHMYKVESLHSSHQNKSVSMLAPHNASPVPTQPTPHPTSSGSGQFRPTPIDLLVAGCYVSPEEHQKRIDEGCCLYYGGFNHMAHGCPNKPKASGHPLCSAAAKLAAQHETPVRSTSTCQPGNV